MSRQYRAVSLISGGLDSMLATKAIMEQGVHVEGINFYTGFCVEGHTHAIRKQGRDKVKRNNSLWVAEQLGIKLHIVDIVEAYKDVVARLMGEDRPIRFLEAEKKGLLKRLFGG